MCKIYFFFWNQKQSKICSTKPKLIYWPHTIKFDTCQNLGGRHPLHTISVPIALAPLFGERKLVIIACCLVFSPPSESLVGWALVSQHFPVMRCMMKQMVAEQSKDSLKVPLPKRVRGVCECAVWWVMQSYQAVIWVLIGSRAASRCLQLQPSLLHYNYTLCLADWQLLNYKWIPCTWIKTKFSANPSPACSLGDGSRYTRAWNKPSRRFHKTTEEVPTRAFSWLKVPTSAFTFKILLKTLCFAKIGSLMQRT